MNKLMKLDKLTKLKMVKEHIYDGVTLNELKVKYDYDISRIKYLCELYRKHGEKAFTNKQIKTYTKEEKINAIRLYESGISYRKIGVEIMLSDPSIVRDWYRKYLNEGIDGIKDSVSRKNYLKKKDRVTTDEYNKVKKELEYLKAENEYLKKVSTLILDRSNRIKKK